MAATGASIEGEIIATSGKIGELTIDEVGGVQYKSEIVPIAGSTIVDKAQTTLICQVYKED